MIKIYKIKSTLIEKNKLKLALPILLVLWLTSFSNCMAQNTQKIAGQYKDGSSLISIFEDNTYLVAGMHAFAFGTVEVKGNKIQLIPHQPKEKFALYGRKVQSESNGHTIMFQGFSDGAGLVNLNGNMESLDVMRRVFNFDANCLDWPNVYDNKEVSKVIYFAEEGSDHVLKFAIPEGYRDFVAFRYEDTPDYGPIYAIVSKDFKSIEFEDGTKLMKEPLTAEIREFKMMGKSMYENVYPEGEFYHINPAYNVFEESGIDINNYVEIGLKNEGVFKLRGLDSSYTEPSSENRLEFDFHDSSIIYEYTKIQPILISKPNYAVDEDSIFTFKCD